jgi:hypothetical protein
MKVCVEDGKKKLVDESNRCLKKLADCMKKTALYLFLCTGRRVQKEIYIASTF